MTINKVLCDGCSKIKGESNHWHKLWINEYERTFRNYFVPVVDGGKAVEKDFCGDACLVREITRIINLSEGA